VEAQKFSTLIREAGIKGSDILYKAGASRLIRKSHDEGQRPR